uniref:Transposase domain-containing protein n=1 Tax=Cacopsylla melanoneura TaxID=428564 RepID=A0A8D9EB70_9HEMI
MGITSKKVNNASRTTKWRYARKLLSISNRSRNVIINNEPTNIISNIEPFPNIEPNEVCNTESNYSITNTVVEIPNLANVNDSHCHTVPGTNNCSQVKDNVLDIRHFDIERMKTELAEWSINCSVNNNQLSMLLNLLKKYIPQLPVDGRTILKTPRHCDGIQPVSPGLYYHFGIEECLKREIIEISGTLIHLVVGIDGLPISKSSKSQFWPILGYIKPNQSNVFMMGIYWGNEKPHDSNEFLKQFVEEANSLFLNGFEYNEKNYKVQIDCFCFDAVAKSFILKIKGHGAYSSCSKCTCQGTYRSGRVSFSVKVGNLRTHDDFVTRVDENHHLSGRTELIKLPYFDIISSVPLDYMHLILIGVKKTNGFGSS